MNRKPGWPMKASTSRIARLAKLAAKTGFDPATIEEPYSAPRTKPQPRTRLPGEPATKATVAERMAEFIIARVACDGGCTKDQLLASGFTEADIKRDFAAAKRQAAQQAPGLVGMAA